MVDDWFVGLMEVEVGGVGGFGVGDDVFDAVELFDLAFDGVDLILGEGGVEVGEVCGDARRGDDAAMVVLGPFAAGDLMEVDGREVVVVAVVDDDAGAFEFFEDASQFFGWV